MSTTFLQRPVSALLASLCIGLAGCASTPAPTLLTLPATTTPVASGSAAMGTPGAAAPVLSLARMEVPEYIASRRVRYRTDDSTLAEWPEAFWAERIEVSLSREFVAALRKRLPGWSICESTCAGLAPAASMRVALDRVDYTRGGRRLTASARVVVNGSAAARRGAEREFKYEFDAGAAADSPQTQAGMYAALLERVAADASAVVLALPPSAP